LRAEPPWGRADRDRVHPVLPNLLDNAVKYAPPGEEVRVNAFQQDSRVRIEVSDRGPGVPADQQRMIFEKFGRGQSAGSPGKPGTGLGLFIARSIAAAHGRSVEVQPATTAGPTFTLTRPA